MMNTVMRIRPILPGLREAAQPFAFPDVIRREQMSSSGAAIRDRAPAAGRRQAQAQQATEIDMASDAVKAEIGAYC